jgi:Ni,Fe-hydrogenase III small subunit
MLLVTGLVSINMEIALRRTYMATPNTKLVVAVVDCVCDGGFFGKSYASLGRISNVIPVNAQIPGCPPLPLTFCWAFSRSSAANWGQNSFVSIFLH